ncbi:hypothetical protein BH11GEM2_BH11GEM2_19130 [soil metagenome]|jgi:hypothetical protein
MHEDLGGMPTPHPDVPKRVTQQGRTFGRIPFAEQADRPLGFQDRCSSATEVVPLEPERRSTGSRPRVTRG